MFIKPLKVGVSRKRQQSEASSLLLLNSLPSVQDLHAYLYGPSLERPSCPLSIVKKGSWEFKEFSGEVEGLLGLKSFVWDSRAGYKVGAGF